MTFICVSLNINNIGNNNGFVYDFFFHLTNKLLAVFFVCTENNLWSLIFAKDYAIAKTIGLIASNSTHNNFQLIQELSSWWTALVNVFSCRLNHIAVYKYFNHSEGCFSFERGQKNWNISKRTPPWWFIKYRWLHTGTDGTQYNPSMANGKCAVIVFDFHAFHIKKKKKK